MAAEGGGVVGMPKSSQPPIAAIVACATFIFKRFVKPYHILGNTPSASRRAKLRSPVDLRFVPLSCSSAYCRKRRQELKVGVH